VLMGWSALYIVSTGELLKVAQTAGGIETRRKARAVMEKGGVAKGECCAIVPFRRGICSYERPLRCLQSME
jgi:hypothetical protein